jgi:hypothetical protein
MTVRQLRVVVQAEDYERAFPFYRDHERASECR